MWLTDQCIEIWYGRKYDNFNMNKIIKAIKNTCAL